MRPFLIILVFAALSIGDDRKLARANLTPSKKAANAMPPCRNIPDEMLSTQTSNLAGIDSKKVPLRRISSRPISALEPRSSSNTYSAIKVNAPINTIKTVEVKNITRDQILIVLSALKKKKLSSKPNSP